VPLPFDEMAHYLTWLKWLRDAALARGFDRILFWADMIQSLNVEDLMARIPEGCTPVVWGYDRYE
jgi:hypothetical protein